MRLQLLLELADPLTQRFIFLAQQLKIGHLWNKKRAPVDICVCLSQRRMLAHSFHITSKASLHHPPPTPVAHLKEIAQLRCLHHADRASVHGNPGYSRPLSHTRFVDTSCVPLQLRGGTRGV